MIVVIPEKSETSLHFSMEVEQEASNMSNLEVLREKVPALRSCAFVGNVETSASNAPFSPIATIHLNEARAEMDAWLVQQEQKMEGITYDRDHQALLSSRIAWNEADTAFAIMLNQLLPACIIHDTTYHTAFTKHLHFDRFNASYKINRSPDKDVSGAPDWSHVEISSLNHLTHVYAAVAVEFKMQGKLDEFKILREASAMNLEEREQDQRTADYGEKLSKDETTEQLRKYCAAGFNAVVLCDYKRIILLIRNGRRFDVVRGDSQDAKKIFVYALWRASVDDRDARHQAALDLYRRPETLVDAIARAAATTDNPTMRPLAPYTEDDASSETENLEDEDEINLLPLRSSFRKGQKLCLRPLSSNVPTAPVTSAESEAVAWTREQLAKLDMSAATQAYEHARSANGVEPYGDYADDAPDVGGLDQPDAQQFPSGIALPSSFAHGRPSAENVSDGVTSDEVTQEDRSQLEAWLGSTDDGVASGEKLSSICERGGALGDSGSSDNASESGASTGLSSCSSAPSSSATTDKLPRGDLQVDQASSGMEGLGQVTVARREYPTALVENLHHYEKVYVRIQEIFPSSNDTAVLKCRLSANHRLGLVGKNFILKFNRNPVEADRERKAYETLKAEQGDLIPYLYGEFYYEKRACLAMEHIPGPSLLKSPDVLQNADTVTAFLRKFEHRWLSLLYHNLSHGDLSLRNVILVNNSLPVLVDFNRAWRVEMAELDFHKLHCELYRNTLAVKRRAETCEMTYARLIRASGVPYFLHCAARARAIGARISGFAARAA